MNCIPASGGGPWRNHTNGALDLVSHSPARPLAGVSGRKAAWPDISNRQSNTRDVRVRCPCAFFHLCFQSLCLCNKSCLTLAFLALQPLSRLVGQLPRTLRVLSGTYPLDIAPRKARLPETEGETKAQTRTGVKSEVGSFKYSFSRDLFWTFHCRRRNCQPCWFQVVPNGDGKDQISRQARASLFFQLSSLFLPSTSPARATRPRSDLPAAAPRAN